MTLVDVFANAALPQKIVLLALAASIPVICIATGLALKEGTRVGLWRGLVADFRIAGPVLGLFVGGLNAFHMGDTIQRLPFNPTAKQLAPAIFEVSTFVALGALVGLVALVAHAAIGAAFAQKRTT